MHRGDSLAALKGLVGNHDHHHGQLVSPHIYVCMYVCMYVRMYVHIYYVYLSPDIAYICVYCQVIKFTQ